ncbi:hypothetical protein BDQ17DRAFT_1538227 [Cyathus striatus]|nr:hypothetical protein BDQ17DRAFT_1538227 [Cyathus striatus]
MNLFGFKRRPSRPPHRTVDPAPTLTPPTPTPPPTPPPHTPPTTLPTPPPPTPPPTTLPTDPDIYSTIHSYTFGAPQPSLHPSYHPLDPLADDDDSPYRADTTPRPSLASPAPHPSHPSQHQPQLYHHLPRQSPPISLTDVPSTSSSPSLSRSNTRRPRSSASSLDCADDRRNPASFHFSDHDGSVASEEEFDDDSDAIEVGSVLHQGSDKASLSIRSASIRGVPHFSDRRIQLAMPIPGTPSDRSFAESRNREDSLATLRRPSRSLEELRPFVSGSRLSHESRDRVLPSEPTSVPGSDAEWFTMRKRSIQRDDSSIGKPASLHTSRTSSAPAAVEGLAPASTDTFDLDFSRYATEGINNLDDREMEDIVKPMTSNRSFTLPFSMIKNDRRRSSVTSNTDPFVHGQAGKEPDWMFMVERSEGIHRDRSSNWKGMTVNSEEIWISKIAGRFSVARKNMINSRDTAKSPQQRINVRHRHISLDGGNVESPPMTIHKHSKSIAFSISRHYRSSKIKAMIILAQPIVQAKSTNTATTRRLESHGLLDDVPRDSSRRPRNRGDDSTSARSESRASKTKKKVKKSSQDDPDSQVSSRGSLAASATLVSGSPPDPSSIESRPGSSCNSENISTASHETNSTTVPKPQPQASETVPQEIEEEDNDLFDDERPQPVRTPHSEAYSTMSPDMLESLSAKTEGKRFIYRSSKVKANGNQNHLLTPYNPPWLLPASRHQTEARNGIVTDLNQSFQDVGLLPVPTADSSRNGQHRHRQSNSKKHDQQMALTNVMEHNDAYYMLLPLWPEETNISSQKPYPPQVPSIPVEQRQYLLVFYKSDLDKSRNPEEGKRSSPTSSWDSLKDDRSPLLSTFHVCARVVSYQELQGTGVRISDTGLAVIGSLEEAYNSMPSFKREDLKFSKDSVIIAHCSSRREEIQFEKHGFQKLKLCFPDLHQPSLVSQDDYDPVLEVTPIGRAVLEMVWLGCIALTGFGSG